MTSAADAPGAGKPSTIKVEKGPFRAGVTLSGTFEASRVAEVSVRPKIGRAHV